MVDRNDAETNQTATTTATPEPEPNAGAGSTPFERSQMTDAQQIDIANGDTGMTAITLKTANGGNLVVPLKEFTWHDQSQARMIGRDLALKEGSSPPDFKTFMIEHQATLGEYDIILGATLTQALVKAYPSDGWTAEKAMNLLLPSVRLQILEIHCRVWYCKSYEDYVEFFYEEQMAGVESVKKHRERMQPILKEAKALGKDLDGLNTLT